MQCTLNKTDHIRSVMLNAKAILIIGMYYRIVQKFRGTKLSRLDHHVSIRGKTFAFASVYSTKVLRDKTFVVRSPCEFEKLERLHQKCPLLDLLMHR